MNLESTIRKLSIGIVGLSLAASISCSNDQYSKAGSQQPTLASRQEQAAAEPGYAGVIDVKQSVEAVSKARVIEKHYHKQFSNEDLYRYYLAEVPAIKNISFENYQKRFQRLNHIYVGWKIDILKLEDLNGNGKVGSRDYFP